MAKIKELAVGVDIGGTNIKVGVVSQKGKIIEKAAVDTLASQGPKAVINQIIKGINLVIGEYKNNIQGIGIGSPGVVSIEQGIVENPPNLPKWKKVHLGKIIKEEFKLETIVENDANAAAIGEMIFGVGKKFNSFIMITLGTGVGGGIIINRDIYRGESGAAGEIGHTTIDYNGPKCNCGSYGCVETYVGNSYLIQRVKRELHGNKNSKIYELLNHNIDLVTPKTIHDAALFEDKFAREFISNTGKYIGYALASMVNSLDISRIVIGGGVAGFGKILFDSVAETIRERALKSFNSRIKVYPAKLKNDAGIQGASSLIFHKWLT